jgi:predicted alpha/beta-hydrolase family hydrolase
VTSSRLVPTPHGDARLVTDRARRPLATLLLNHGAGGGIESHDLVALARELPRQGISVIRLEMPWKVAGKKLAARPQVLDECLESVVPSLRLRTPLVLGGRSAGARVAARTADRVGASGCLALAFPLHPPGKPEKSRLDELDGVKVPELVVQGERDAFGRPEEFPETHDLAVVPGADHGFHVPKRGDLSQEEALDLIVEATLEWIVREVAGNRSGA